MESDGDVMHISNLYLCFSMDNSFVCVRGVILNGFEFNAGCMKRKGFVSIDDESS